MKRWSAIVRRQNAYLRSKDRYGKNGKTAKRRPPAVAGGRESPDLPMIWSVFEKKKCVVQTFFDSSSKINVENDVNWQISIMNDLMSRCFLQKNQFCKTNRQRKNRIIECDFDAKCIWNVVTFKSFKFESKFQIRQFFSLKCKQYQCFYCFENRILFLKKRLHNFDNKFLLRRHFDRCHIFRSSEFCFFFYVECAVITLNSMMHFKNHVVKIHEIYMF